MCECRSSLSMCSAVVASKQCTLKTYHCSSLQLLLPLTMRELHKLRPIHQQQVHACRCVHGAWLCVCLCVCVCVFVYVSVCVYATYVLCGFRYLTVRFLCMWMICSSVHARRWPHTKLQSHVHMCAVITVFCQINVIVDIIASGLPFASCFNLTLPMHAPTHQPLPEIRVVYFAFCAHNPLASTPAPACPQVSLLWGSDPQSCMTSLQLRE